MFVDLGSHRHQGENVILQNEERQGTKGVNAFCPEGPVEIPLVINKLSFSQCGQGRALRECSVLEYALLKGGGEK